MTAAQPMPDWNDYPIWSDTTDYQHTLIVAQAHPAADDANDGTTTAPLRTIQAAAERVQPGQRVVIHRGVYPELVAPVRGGSGSDAMISFEAAPGERVIISGARAVTTAWHRPRIWDDGFAKGEAQASLSQRVWVTTLDPALFSDDYQPFALANVEPNDEKLMDWMEPVSGLSPFPLKRGMLYQDEQRLTQLNHPGDVARVPGSFWVDADNLSLVVHPYGSGDPRRSSFSVAVQAHLLRPQSIGLDYIRLSGLEFAYCANGFLRAATGAVTTRGGGHWIIEDCTIRECNNTGLEFGDRAVEWNDTSPSKAERRWFGSGHMLVRRNHIFECGTAGIRCLRLTEGRVLDNHIHDCGWQDAEYYYECAGIKLLCTVHCLIQGNHLHHLVGACGLWLDWDNQFSRATENHIHDVIGKQGGIFVEASRTPNLVDRNIMWRIDGPGIFGGDSSNQLYLHNLIGHTTDSPVVLKCHTERILNKSVVTCVDNLISHTVFVDPIEPYVEDDQNHFLSNTFITTGAHLDVDVAAWQGRGYDADLRQFTGACDLTDDGQRLTWQWSADEPQPSERSAHPTISHAFGGQPWHSPDTTGAWSMANAGSWSFRPE